MEISVRAPTRGPRTLPVPPTMTMLSMRIDSSRLNDEGSMVLEGEIRSFVQNSSSPFRGTWTPIDDGVVRQFFEIGNAETGVFTPWFDGLYLRKDPAPDR